MEEEDLKSLFAKMYFLELQMRYNFHNYEDTLEAHESD
jgi:hypothetical protein